MSYSSVHRRMTIFKEFVTSTGQIVHKKLVALRQLVHCLGQVLENKMLVFRCVQFVQSISQGLTFILATILLTLIGNRLWDKEQKDDSWAMTFLRDIPMSFIHYSSLSATTLISFLCHQFFMKLQDTGPLPLVLPTQHPRVGQTLYSPAALPETRVIGPPHPPATGPADPEATAPPHRDLTVRPLDHRATGPPALGILDNDLRVFFGHLKQHCGLPAPAMLPTSAIESISWAQASPGNMALTVHIKGVVTNVEVVYRPVVTLPGSRVLHRRFEIGPQTGELEVENLRNLVLESMSRARLLDPDCTLQFGSFAVMKYTEAGLKWWRLEKHWTPTISDIRQSPLNLLDSLNGSCKKWIIKGFNLQTATLKASTMDDSEDIIILQCHKTESGEDVLVCEEPHLVRISAPIFTNEVYICASNSVEVEEGVIFNLQSEPKNVRRSYWIFMMEYLMPRPWTVTMVCCLTLLGGWSRGTHGKHGDHFEGISSLSQFLNEPLNFFLVCMFAVFYFFFVSTLWRLSRARTPLAGNFLSHRTSPFSTSIPSPTFQSLVEEDLLDDPVEDTTSIPSPTTFQSLVEEDLLEDPVQDSTSIPSPRYQSLVEEDSLEDTVPTKADNAMETFVGLQGEGPNVMDHDGEFSSGEPQSDSGNEASISWAASSNLGVWDQDDGESSQDNMMSGVDRVHSVDCSSYCSQMEIMSPDNHFDAARMTAKHGGREKEGPRWITSTSTKKKQWSQDPSLPSDIPELSPLRLSQSRLFHLFLNMPDQLPTEEGHYPPLPLPGELRIVRCQHCELPLQVPDDLPPNQESLQKLRCRSCMNVSTFSIRQAESPNVGHIVSFPSDDSLYSQSSLESSLGNEELSAIDQDEMVEQTPSPRAEPGSDNGDTGYPSLPSQGELPHVLCQHCGILLRVPDNLRPHLKDRHKLRCGLSRFAHQI